MGRMNVPSAFLMAGRLQIQQLRTDKEIGKNSGTINGKINKQDKGKAFFSKHKSS